MALEVDDLMGDRAGGGGDVCHVGLDRGEVDRESVHCVDGLRQPAGPAVVLGETVDVVVEGVDAGGGVEAARSPVPGLRIAFW